MGLGCVITNLLSLGAQLIPVVNASAQAPPSSSSCPPVESQQIETELKELMRLLERIKARLYDAEERRIRDLSVMLWLKELREVAYDAEDVLDEYHYEVLRAQVEARDASPKRKLCQVPDSMLGQIRQIRSTFAKITEDRIALQLSEDDGPRRCSSDMQIVPTSHFVVKSGIIPREREKKKLINLLSSESNDGNIISVVTIVGAGGIGKTTLAQLVYNDQNFRQNFDKVGWIFVAQDFNVHRLSRELGESIKKRSLDFANLSALQENISEEMRGKKIFLVLDDVWNENKNLWELFQLPFTSASLVKILVTTRNKSVARLMQTEPDATYNIPYMSEEQSWQMFQHFAFGKVVPHADSNFVEIGKEIMRKCGKLPLAIKSIASLLRHEPNEENWKEILESELWKSDASDEIFWPLLISYAHLPTYLKPCFLYCSLLPKYYSNDAEKMSSSRRTYFNDAEILVKLWISQGYVQTEKIGWIYVKQLYERSFLEGIGVLAENIFCFTMHDIVHDLARSILGNGCFSIVGNTILNFPEELRHLYVHYSQKEPLEPPLFPSDTFATLRTLIVDDHGHLLPKKKQIVKDYLGKQFLSAFDISKAHKLRALHLWIRGYLKFDISFEKLKHLRYLFLGGKAFERLPKCICSLYKLQNLTLEDFPYLMELPESIKNLVSLEELTITRCPSLKLLPVSFNQLKALQKLYISWCTAFEELPCNMGNLTNLQLLKIDYTEIISLPPSLNKIIRRTSLQVRLVCKTIGWLENFVDLKGTLWLVRLNLVSLNSFHGAILVRMHNLQHLVLAWNDSTYKEDKKKFNKHGSLELCISLNGKSCSDMDSSDENMYYESESSEDLSLMVRLQPHLNLRKLDVRGYRSLTFPDWIGNPTLCASLDSIELESCNFIRFLPFGGLHKLKYLSLERCASLQHVQEQSLPLVLEEIYICSCQSLESVTGIQKLKSLVKLQITNCRELCCLDHNGKSDRITISYCPKLKDFCSQHDIKYLDSESNVDTRSESSYGDESYSHDNDGDCIESD